MDRTKASAMIVMLLFCSGASLSKSLRLEHSVDGMNEKDEKRAVAVGVPFGAAALVEGLATERRALARGDAGHAAAPPD